MSSMINDLQNPGSLPDMTENVQVIQTHISIVFVADEFVYKVKKPVNFGFLNFSSLEKRNFYCHREVKLNRRLSEGIYIDVLPIYLDEKTYTMRDGQGEIVEYAVKMKRIPDDKLMKEMFGSGLLLNDHLKRVAGVLADFHSNAENSPEIDQFGRPESFQINTDENFEQVEKYRGITIEEKTFDAIRVWTDVFYRSNKDLFFERIKSGRIRDCHGDLHMEHICLTDPLQIIDCIEFNDRFRYSDTIADIAFLLMDLEYHGGKDEAKTLWKYYKELAKEKDVNALLSFYKVYRAFVRGKVISFQLDDESISRKEKEEAVDKAKKYFKLACSYTQ
ncbi:MAG: phosphotransferase [Deltaproteobacteria bacterium]|nr:phosphotransferase [Deltaproteobacteria bacterium]